jgi:hypothetical protein
MASRLVTDSLPADAVAPSTTSAGGPAEVASVPARPAVTVTSMVVGLTTVPLAATGGLLVGLRLAGSPMALPCPMDELFGLACPLCGVWRGTTGLLAGDGAVIAAQASAIAVSVTLGIGAALSLVGWARRRGLDPRLARVIAVAIGAALAVNWVVQLARVM